MRRIVVLCVLIGLFTIANSLNGYVEVPYSLGQVVNESTNVVLMEVTKVNKEKNLLIFKKVKDLKGTHPKDEIKHNIGQRGFHAREWQNIMSWADVGKKAVFFHNGGASETCIGGYWYQCYPEGEWWGLSHAEPFLLRTYCGDTEKLAGHVTDMIAGKEVIVPCFVDANKEQLHQKKGKLQRLRASLKRLNYDPKRDFVAFGGDGDEIEEFKTTVVLAESSPGWRFLPAAQLKGPSESQWRQPEFDDVSWGTSKTPIGYGEEEITKRQGTTIGEQGVPFVFRRPFTMPKELLSQKGAIFRVTVASDDSAIVYLNGKELDKDPEEDHEFTYWNREIELKPDQLREGRNVIAVIVKNKQGSSDLFFDMEVSVQVPVLKPPKQPQKP